MFAPIYTKAGTDPDTVTSPAGDWQTREILYTCPDWSLARGIWDGRNVLAMRWNRFVSEIGFPSSHGYPTWFIIPSELNRSYLQSDLLTDAQKTSLRAILGDAPDQEETNKGIPPRLVETPREAWKLEEVLYECCDWSLAAGWYKHVNAHPVLVIRWNGDENSKGSPITSGQPAWFVIPTEQNDLYLNSPFLLPEKKARMAAFLQEEVCVA